MKKKVAIIDYGMGNLYSVFNAFRSLGIKAEIISTPQGLDHYDKMVLPGVGAFGDAMKELNKRNFVEPIRDFIAMGKPFLGICLGMQLLFSKSQEACGIKGLDIIAGEVKKFSCRLKCPHMGWNKVEKRGAKQDLFKGIKGDLYAYFCHSYYVKPESSSFVIGWTRYERDFVSIVRSGRVYAMQFHPEKSQKEGLVLLKNFIELC